MNAPRRRADIVGRDTRYEVAISVDGAQVDVLGYVSRKTRQSLLLVAREHGARVIALSGVDGDSPFREWSASRITLGRASVHYTGRTEREAN